MSSAEVIHQLKKLVGKFEKEMGIRVFPTATDHEFKPDIVVTDRGVEIPVNGFVVMLKAKDCDIKYNIDRPVTSSEYDVVFKDTIHIINRVVSKIYAKAPSGFDGKLYIKSLKVT